MMGNLTNRLSKLENRILDKDGRPSHYVMMLVGNQSEEEISRFLIDQGHAVDDDTLVIQLCAVEPSPNGPKTSDMPLEVLSSSLGDADV